MPRTADLAIVIVNWNTRQLLLDCLATLPAATAGLLAETWVVDNGSSDGSVAAVRAQFPQINVIANGENRGFAAANNQAIRASASRYVLLLNSDTLARPDSLTAMVRFLDAHLTVGIAGARLLNADGSLQPSYAAFPNLGSELLGKNLRVRRRFPGHPEAFAVDWVGGACLMIRRAILGAVGLLDEAYFMYTEEADWCYRVRALGAEVCYLPWAEVVHLGGQSSKKASLRMRAELHASKLRFFAKHYGPAQATALGRGLQTLLIGRAAVGALLDTATGRRDGRAAALGREGSVLWQAIDRQLTRQRAERV